MALPEDEDWLMRPVLEGLIRYTDLLGTQLTLEDIALMNDALDVKHENELRYMKAKEKQRAG